ncbi:MAG TPA: ferritin-like domain-containing protein [Methanosarcina sp.]|nr:ferritin-like domain-containing protein [Methanosarcina sp.]
MDKTRLQTLLEEVFSANFVVYYRAHVAHVNVKGPNFYQYHGLLNEVYSKLQEHIDILGETLQTIKTKMPNSLGSILTLSPIIDYPTTGNSIDLLNTVVEGIESLIGLYQELALEAEASDFGDVENLAQNSMSDLTKLRWKIESTLEDE